MSLLINPILWIGVSGVFLLLNIIIGIVIYLMYKKTHMIEEIKASFSNTPIGLFFQDNKFMDWRPVTPINGVVYDDKYGPFIVQTTYVDKRTKNILIPFDIDMDGDRTSDIKKMVSELRNITNNKKSIEQLRYFISTKKFLKKDVLNKLNLSEENIKNLTSFISYGTFKDLFKTEPHNIRSKIEKMVSKRMDKQMNVDPMQAIIVFAAIFGIIVFASIILKSVAGV